MANINDVCSCTMSHSFVVVIYLYNIKERRVSCNLFLFKKNHVSSCPVCVTRSYIGYT